MDIEDTLGMQIGLLEIAVARLREEQDVEERRYTRQAYEALSKTFAQYRKTYAEWGDPTEVAIEKAVKGSLRRADRALQTYS